MTDEALEFATRLRKLFTENEIDAIKKDLEEEEESNGR